MNPTEIYRETFAAAQRDRRQFGMDSGEREFDPSRNPFRYADDDDLANIDWDDDRPGDDEPDDDVSDDDLDEMERAIKAAKRSLGITDEEEDDSESEDEAEDEDEAIGFGKAGMRDSRRGARQAEDEDEGEGEKSFVSDLKRKLKLKKVMGKRKQVSVRCRKCGESNRVKAPAGTRFVNNDISGKALPDWAKTPGMTDYKKVRWACQFCGRWNKADVKGDVRQVQRADATEAVSAFRRAYRAEPHTPDANLDPISTFRESYGMNNDLAHWKACVAKHGG